MSKDRRESDYPVELESQFILRLPEEPAKILRDILTSGDSLKNRLTIQMENDLRNGEVRLDHWLMHAKIVDLPAVIESLKTIDNKSFYKTADICQMMICKYEADQPSIEEESPSKIKKKDPYKVDKKFLWPHGITPPTKNVRKRRFRKTLKKKYVEAPEIEKEVKRLLRADNEAASVSWEIIKDETEQNTKPEVSTPASIKAEKMKVKQELRNLKIESRSDSVTQESSNVVDIFGGAVSDSDLEDDNINVDMDDSRLSAYDSRLSDSNSMHGVDSMKDKLPTQFRPEMFQSPRGKYSGETSTALAGHSRSSGIPGIIKSGGLSSEEDSEFQSGAMSKGNITMRIEELSAEIEELKQRRQRTQHEISGLENLALRQRFQETLQTINQDILYKELEYKKLQNMQQVDDM